MELTKNLMGIPELRSLKDINLVDYSVRRTLEEIYARTGITIGNSPEDFANFRTLLKEMKAIKEENRKVFGVASPVVQRAYGLTQEQADMAFKRLTEVVKDPVLGRLFDVAYDVIVKDLANHQLPPSFLVAMGDILRTGYTPTKLEAVQSIYENMQTLLANLKPKEREVFREKLGMLLGDIANRAILRPDELRGRLDDLLNIQSLHNNQALKTALMEAVGKYYDNVRTAEAMSLNIAQQKLALRQLEDLYQMKKEQYAIVKKAQEQYIGNKGNPDCV